MRSPGRCRLGSLDPSSPAFPAGPFLGHPVVAGGVCDLVSKSVQILQTFRY